MSDFRNSNNLVLLSITDSLFTAARTFPVGLNSPYIAPAAESAALRDHCTRLAAEMPSSLSPSPRRPGGSRTSRQKSVQSTVSASSSSRASSPGRSTAPSRRSSPGRAPAPAPPAPAARFQTFGRSCSVVSAVVSALLMLGCLVGISHFNNDKTDRLQGLYSTVLIVLCMHHPFVLCPLSSDSPSFASCPRTFDFHIDIF